MPEFGERIYELGAGALAEQERAVSEIRGRGAPLLAGGAVIAGLLAKPIFQSGHPDGFAEWAAAISGLLAVAALLTSVVALWVPYVVGFSLRSQKTYQELWNAGLIDQPLVDLALAEAFDDRYELNKHVVGRLQKLLAIALVSLIVETGGLALAAALAS